MDKTKFDDLISKAEDNIKVVNVFEEIINFIKEIKPTLDKINNSIHENLKKMPSASKKISKVTEATEIATTEMLNLLDNIFPKIDMITSEMNTMKERVEKSESLFIDVLKKIKTGIENKNDLTSILPELDKLIQVLDGSEDRYPLNNINEELQNISTDATSIMMALQVQDITSQQLAAVKHLLDNIQGKLGSILDKVDNEEFKNLLGDDPDSNVTDMHRQIAFDPDAVDTIDQRADRQQMVDDFFSGDSSIEDTASEEESVEKEEVSQNTEEKAEDQLEEEEASSEAESPEKEENSDIDNAVLNEIEDDEPISQDDIDKLFG